MEHRRKGANKIFVPKQIAHFEAGMGCSQVGTNGFEVGAEHSEVGANRSEVGTIGFKVGANGFEVGANHSEVGANGFEVGANFCDGRPLGREYCQNFII